MTIRWNETVDDALVFYKFYIETDTKVKRNMRVLQFFVPVISLIILIPIIEDSNLGVGLMLFFLVWMGVFPLLRRRQLLYKARKEYMKPKNLRYFGERELILSEKGFLLKTEFCETLYKWKTVTTVKRVEGYCFIDIEEQETLIIPEYRLVEEETTALSLALEKYVQIGS
ncbi:MAG: hypothetical protein GX963_04265 [Bacteroidales bacterium]|nr:hypothetical protein [Bacteroidales bacterium]